MTPDRTSDRTPERGDKAEGDRARFAPTRRATLVAWLLAVLMTAGGAALLLAVRDSLPEQIAAHWGSGGKPDRFAGFTETLITGAALTFLSAAVPLALSFLIDRSTRNITAGLAAGLATGVGTLSFGSAYVQRDAGGTDLPGLLLVVSLAIGLGVGLLVGLLGRPARPVLHERPPVPASAPRADVPAGARVSWVSGTPVAAGTLIGLLVPLVVLCGYLAVTESPWLWLLIAPVAVLAVGMIRARVIIDDQGLRVVGFGFVTWSHVPLDRVSSAEAGQVRVIKDFGGWGWRVGRDGRRAYVSRSGEALVVHRLDEPDVLVTLDQADQAARVLNTLTAQAAATSR